MYSVLVFNVNFGEVDGILRASVGTVPHAVPCPLNFCLILFIKMTIILHCRYTVITVSYNRRHRH